VSDPDLRNLPVSILRVDVRQPRNGPGNRAALDALKDSMAQLGRTVQHVTVSPTGDGSYRIISGHRRVQAAIELGWEWLPAVIVEDSDDDAERLLRQIAENCARAGLLPIELCEAIAQLRDRVDPAEIARATGVSLRTVYNYLAILDHPDLVETLRQGRTLRAVLADVAARGKADNARKASISVGRIRRSVEQLINAWGDLDPDERSRLASRLRPLLDSIETASPAALA